MRGDAVVVCAIIGKDCLVAVKKFILKLEPLSNLHLISEADSKQEPALPSLKVIRAVALAVGLTQVDIRKRSIISRFEIIEKMRKNWIKHPFLLEFSP